MVDWVTVLAFARPTLSFFGEAAWPISAAFIALRFRQPISEAINRAKRFSAFGAELDMPPPQQQLSADQTIAAASASLSVTPEPQHDAVLAPVEAHFFKALENEPLSPEQRYHWAVRVAASQAMLARHEQHYRLIFGSQIAFLKYVNVAGFVSIADAQRFFDEYKAKDLNNPLYHFQNWLNFMMGAGNDLEGFVSENAVEQVRLTPTGRAFLLWLAAQAAPENKPF
jgi:hypothetical protein